MPLSRNLANIRPGLHELRFRDKAGQVRVLDSTGATKAAFVALDARERDDRC